MLHSVTTEDMTYSSDVHTTWQTEMLAECEKVSDLMDFQSAVGA